MKSVYHPIAAISTMGAILCTLVSPAIAAEMWSGRGQITRGEGRGGYVRLQLAKNGNNITFYSGPDQGKRLRLKHSSGKTRSGNLWRVQKCGTKLCITLKQSKPKSRVIRYLLKRSQ
ncbi:hypothetical protein [Calothrix rhizosoleniae]|uniref:hypothetical protein n=1 Tax=Calothrix rhizosoleniae TaxID=888997 RepID=UPI000B4A2BAE|nr:hypothetical protein [Calothrix rhizosoleniae]